MAVKLEVLNFWAAGGRFTALLSSRYPDVNKIRGERIAGREISAEQIANLIDNGAVAEIHVAERGLHPGERAVEYGGLTMPVLLVRFIHDGVTLDEIYFDVTPAGRSGPDRFVELFNQAAREGYCR
jgi:hypothetical protein